MTTIHEQNKIKTIIKTGAPGFSYAVSFFPGQCRHAGADAARPAFGLRRSRSPRMASAEQPLQVKTIIKRNLR